MPLTIAHAGPALLFGLLLFSSPAAIFTIVVSSMMIDLEPLFSFILGIDYPYHGFLHSFLGAAVVSLIVSSAVLMFFKNEKKIRIVSAAVFGTLLHVLPDSLINTDVEPFFPLEMNPFYLGYKFEIFVYMFCAASFILAAYLLITRRYRVIK